MNNRITILIIVLFFANMVNSGEPDIKLHEDCLYPSVMITVTCGPQGGFGSGVIVKSKKVETKTDDETKVVFKNYAFTCEHVLLEPIKLVTSDGGTLQILPNRKIRVGKYENWSKYTGFDEYNLEVLYSNREKDIALVVFETDKEMPVATFYKDNKLYIGNDVTRVGCGLGEPFRVDFGKMTSLRESVDKTIHSMRGTYRISANTVQGDSGGGVFHEYQLIGVAQAIRNMPGNLPICYMTYVIPIERFLEQEEISSIIKQPDIQED